MQKYNPVDMNKIVKIESTCKLLIISAVHNFCIQLKKKNKKKEKGSLNLSEETIQHMF